MESLLIKCIKKILELNISFNKHLLPEEIIEKIDKFSIIFHCGNNVRRIFEMEKSLSIDPYFGCPVDGIQGVLQHKRYIARNIQGYESAYKQKFYRQCFPKVPYILYYLEQEEDYVIKYPQKRDIKIYDFDKFFIRIDYI